jgi:hypothetical protein
MPIERELMRSCLLAALRATPQTQFENLKYAVATVASERGMQVRTGSGGQQMLDRVDFRRLRELIWELIGEGVLVVGMDDSNESWPFLSLTEYGERYVVDQRASPHDRTEYLAKMTAVAPLDETENRYVQQALTAYVRGLIDASAVMIGAASEHVLILTVSDIEAKDASVSGDAHRCLAGPALGMLRFVQGYFVARLPNLPRDLRESLDTTFVGIAALIRQARNDGGHPALPSVDRERCFVALQLYPDYRAWLFEARALLPL